MPLAQGGERVTLWGANFGPMGSLEPVVRYGSGGRSFTAVNCSALAAPVGGPAGAVQQTECLSVPGVGQDLLWTMTTRSLVSVPFAQPMAGNATASASRYLPPAIAFVTPAAPLLSTRGRQTVVLRGTNFGPAAFERESGLLVTYGPVQEAGRRYAIRNCVVDAVSPNTAIVCTTVSGVGTNHVWRVTVGAQESAPSANTTSYLSPTISAVTGQGTYQAKTEGGQVVSIAGALPGPGDLAGSPPLFFCVSAVSLVADREPVVR